MVAEQNDVLAPSRRSPGQAPYPVSSPPTRCARIASHLTACSTNAPRSPRSSTAQTPPLCTHPWCHCPAAPTEADPAALLCADCDPLTIDGLCYHCEDGCPSYSPPQNQCTHYWCMCPADPTHWEGICIECDPLPFSLDACHHCGIGCPLLPAVAPVVAPPGE